ncbi:hypothetical protein AeMF1_018092 [Aphanomyces euteiches]|nr:hypothetical protein AeMF1_018092 [Aphanomyces euteiches]KAH9189065.1 hypothetical protein AeNC1_008964 [Aphanomyces euteiches]
MADTSATNQLRLLVLAQTKEKRRRRKPKSLDPLKPSCRPALNLQTIRKRMLEPTTLQMLVDEFIESAGEGLEDRVDMFIRAGLPIDRTHTVLGYTALHAAANQADGKVMARLIRAGANVNALSKTHTTPLHTAVLYGNQASVEKLLGNKAERNIHDRANMAPTDVAIENDRQEINVLLQGPPLPPQMPKCTLVEPCILHISWELTPRPRSKVGTPASTSVVPFQFKVLWRRWRANAFHDSTCSSQEFVLRGLTPATMYEIFVQAANSAGRSANSAPLVVKTAETVPTAPKAPRIMSVSDKSVKMQVFLPESNGHPLDRIRVLVQKTGSINLSDTSGIVTLMDVKTNELAWVQLWDGSPIDLPSVRGDASIREFVAQGLSPGHIYYFRIKAANTLGWSDMGVVSDGISTNDAPKLAHKTGTSLGLIWPKPYSAFEIDCYKLEYKIVAAPEWTIVSTRIHDQKFTVTNLLPATAYVFRVRPHYSKVPIDVSEWEDPANCAVSPIYHTQGTVPDAPSNIELLSRSQTSLELSWKTPRCNGHVCLNYELQKQQMLVGPTDHNDFSQALVDPSAIWEVVSNAIDVDCFSFHVNGLTHGLPYRFRLRARNALGWSPDGEPSNAFFTHAFLPPTPPEAFSKTHHSLEIAWADQAADLNDMIDMKEYFEVQVCVLRKYCAHDAIPEIHIETWDVVKDRCVERKCVVSNLSALTWYCFRVRSWIRYRGWTEFSDPSKPIQTLRRM